MVERAEQALASLETTGTALLRSADNLKENTQDPIFKISLFSYIVHAQEKHSAIRVQQWNAKNNNGTYRQKRLILSFWSRPIHNT